MNTATVAQLLSMSSGECRWIGRHDVHVYCHAPRGRDARFSVLCSTVGRQTHNWMPAADAVGVIDAIFTKVSRDD
jgi:hypothetical protein